MKKTSLVALSALALALAACGQGNEPEVGDDEALLQIVSEGGFVPVEFALATGPRYTLLGDGRLIFQGVQTLEFPGRLVPPYMVARLNDSQMNAVLAMVDDIGLPEIDDEVDNDANQFVADAPTDVITFWDDNGRHRLSVYALGIDTQDPQSDRNAALLELIDTFDRFTAEADAEPYAAEAVRVIAGPGFVNEDFQDTRPWPLDDDWGAWASQANGWVCRVLQPDVLDVFADATQATVWDAPEGLGIQPPVKLLVRPLLPGESDCP